jgi:competence protein ComK
MLKKQVYTAYHEVSPYTMAVVASRNEEGVLISYILDDNAEYISSQSPSKIMDAACMFFGSSLKGRQEGTRNVSGLTHKVPISIDPAAGMYFFPTYSPLSPKCSWINHSHIEEVLRSPEGNSEIIFKNGKNITLDVSYGSLINQIHRTAQFRFLLDDRINSLKSEMVAERITPLHTEEQE